MVHVRATTEFPVAYVPRRIETGSQTPRGICFSFARAQRGNACARSPPSQRARPTIMIMMMTMTIDDRRLQISPLRRGQTAALPRRARPVSWWTMRSAIHVGGGERSVVVPCVVGSSGRRRSKGLWLAQSLPLLSCFCASTSYCRPRAVSPPACALLPPPRPPSRLITRV